MRIIKKHKAQILSLMSTLSINYAFIKKDFFNDIEIS